MNSEINCPLCSGQAGLLPVRSGPQEFDYDCPRCGKYTLTAPILEQLNHKDILPEEKDRFILSSYIREFYENSNQVTKLSEDNFYEILNQAKASIPSFSERIFKLLSAIERRLPHAGDTVNLRREENEHYLMAMSYSLDKGEFFYYVECLEELGYISHPDNRNLIGYQLTSKAWEYLEEHKAKDRTRSDKAFIAMDFKKEYEPIYKAIEKSVTEAGYKPIRADKEHHSEYIMDWIMNQIKEARFIVAELTSQNLGVYYEFGYAKAMDVPIIACLKKLGLRVIEWVVFSIFYISLSMQVSILSLRYSSSRNP